MKQKEQISLKREKEFETSHIGFPLTKTQKKPFEPRGSSLVDVSCGEVYKIWMARFSPEEAHYSSSGRPSHNACRYVLGASTGATQEGPAVLNDVQDDLVPQPVPSNFTCATKATGADQPATNDAPSRLYERKIHCVLFFRRCPHYTTMIDEEIQLLCPSAVEPKRERGRQTWSRPNRSKSCES